MADDRQLSQRQIFRNILCAVSLKADLDTNKGFPFSRCSKRTFAWPVFGLRMFFWIHFILSNKIFLSTVNRSSIHFVYIWKMALTNVAISWNANLKKTGSTFHKNMGEKRRHFEHMSVIFLVNVRTQASSVN